MFDPPYSPQGATASGSTVTSKPSSKPIAASSRLYDIAPLADDGSNYQTWKFRVQTVLDIRGLWDVVGGPNTTCPDAVTHPDDYLEWCLKDEEASAQITLALKHEPSSGAKSASETWRKLSERCERKRKQTIAHLIGELFRGTLVDDSPMGPQLNAMRQKASILGTLGQPLDDSLVAMAMLISLPQSYSTLRTVLTLTNDKVTADAVISQVLIEERTRRASQTHGALVTKKGNGGNPKSKGKGKGRIRCYGCKELGHTKDKCTA